MENIMNRNVMLGLIEKQLARKDILPHWRTALVVKKLMLMGYPNVQPPCDTES